MPAPLTTIGPFAPSSHIHVHGLYMPIFICVCWPCKKDDWFSKQEKTPVGVFFHRRSGHNRSRAKIKQLTSFVSGIPTVNEFLCHPNCSTTMWIHMWYVLWTSCSNIIEIHIRRLSMTTAHLWLHTNLIHSGGAGFRPPPVSMSIHEYPLVSMSN